MSDFPLARILDFLRTVVPFDTLDGDELARLVARMEIAYYPRGATIIEAGGAPAENLFVIHSGSVKVTVPDPELGEILVDVRGEGDSFGSVSLTQGLQALFTVKAQEDLLVFLLPAQEFRRLLEEKPSFQRHFSFSLSRNIQAVRRSADPHLSQMTGTESLKEMAAQMRSLVMDLMNRNVLTCKPDQSIRQAAELMRGRGVSSIIVVNGGGEPVGIITDTDLRNRVVASGLDTSAPVEQAMSRPIMTISPQAYAFEAMLQMTRHGTHHLVAAEGGRMVGVLSDHDIKVLTGATPVGLAREIEKLASLDELPRLPGRILRVLEMLLRLGSTAYYMMDVLSEFNDRVIIKVLELCEKHLAEQGMGPPPVSYTWLAVADPGRREQAPPLRQDHILVHSDLPEGAPPDAARWFLALGQAAAEALSRCGLCGRLEDIKGADPRWCRSAGEWKRVFAGWAAEPTPQTLAKVDVLFDFRPVMGEGTYPEQLRRHALEAVAKNRFFLRQLARLSYPRQPPLGFLREKVVERDGSYSERVNLEQQVLRPMVEGARVLALDIGMRETNTMERLAGAAQEGIINERLSADLRAAFSFVTVLRISRFLEARGGGTGAGAEEFLEPNALNRVQRNMLRDSFAVTAELQEKLVKRYGPMEGA